MESTTSHQDERQRDNPNAAQTPRTAAKKVAQPATLSDNSKGVMKSGIKGAHEKARRQRETRRQPERTLSRLPESVLGQYGLPFGGKHKIHERLRLGAAAFPGCKRNGIEIGRASCRERVCQYV